jgi:predicted transcriptional regulator
MDPRSSRRRERTDLFAEILEVIKRYHGQARVTRVSYAVGMPVDRLKSSLERLSGLGLVRSESVADVVVYELTPRGQQFLDTYWKMRAFTEMLERDPEGIRSP